jgi:hypothetical protein
MLTMKARSNLLAAVAAFSVSAYGAVAMVAGCSNSDSGGAGGAAGAGGAGVTGGAAGTSSTGGSSGSGGAVVDASKDTSTGTGGGTVVPEAGPPPACDGGANSCTVGGCPPPVAGRICCLHKYNDNSIQGTSTTLADCQGGIFATIECQNNLGDTKGCPQEQTCCGVLPDVPGGPTGSRCIPHPQSAPSGFCGTNPYICGPTEDGGPFSATAQCVPGAGTASAYVCLAAPGTPLSALSVCVESDAGGG